MDTMTIQLAQRGVMTLPKSLRDTYGLKRGDELTLLDLGGVFVLSPRRSEVDALARKVATAFSDRGETLENMLIVLREERERYGMKAGGKHAEQSARVPGHKRIVRRHLVGSRRSKDDLQAR